MPGPLRLEWEVNLRTPARSGAWPARILQVKLPGIRAKEHELTYRSAERSLSLRCLPQLLRLVA